MRSAVVLIAVLLALPAAARAQSPGATPPAATTGAARDVARTSATLTGTVDPNRSATTYRFEYGTTTAYGLTTPDRDAGAGDAAVPAEMPVSGLTPGTTYHYRLVATSAAGTTMGADRTLRTVPDPRPPGVSETGTVTTGPDSAVVRAAVDPNGSPTTFHFDYGESRDYGLQTPERDAGAGDADVLITETLPGLLPYRTYHFRLVATNEAGTVTSLDRTLVTSRLPTGITIALDSPTTPWGQGVEVFGTVSGTGRDGMPIGVERQDFPFSAPFTSLGTPVPVRADRFGRFRMFVPALFAATRLRAVTRTPVAVTSPVVTANVALTVSVAARRAPMRRVRISGSVQPAAPNGRAVLQRRTAGGWRYVRRTRLAAAGADRSRYSFTVARGSRTERLRVRVSARDGGAHVPGTSPSVLVKRLPRR